MSLSAGTKLGPYEILAPLGAGGMGEVYRARDTRLGRDVAVKVLPEGLSNDPEALARFDREERIVAALSHPNILAIHDIGREGDVRFAVMELLEGETLRSRLDRERMPVRRVIDAALQTAQGLAAAHEKGIVHRDLKPENLFVTNEGRVKILDFGLAKPSRAPMGRMSEAPTAVTLPGAVLGTVAYMSPEQVRGAETDARSDIFSFGAVLYEMLSGRQAFHRETAVETMTAVLREQPPPLEDSGRGLSLELVRLVEHCLEKRPEDRFQSAKDLAFALSTVAGERSSDSRTAHLDAVEAPPSIAVLPFRNISSGQENDYFSEGMTEEIINALSKIETLKVAARTSSFAFRGKEEDVRKIGKELGVRTVLEGSVRQAGQKLRISAQLIDVATGYHLWSERFDRGMEDVFAVQDEIARAIAETLKVRLFGGASGSLVSPGTRDVEAYDLYLQGRYSINQRDLPRAISSFEQAIVRDGAFAAAHTGLSDALAIQGFYGGVDTREAFSRARRATETARSLEPDSAEVHLSLGIIEHYYGWDFAKEEREVRLAVERSPKSATAIGWLCLHLGLQGRPEEGVAMGRRGLEIEPLQVNVRTSLGWCLFLAGRGDEAVDEMRRAAEIGPSVTYPLWSLGFIRLMRGEFDEAIARLTRSVSVDPAGTFCLALLGGALAKAGRRDEAQGILRELDERGTRGYVAPFHRSIVQAGLGDHPGAIASLEQALVHRNALTWWWIRSNPLFDWLRSDPAFARLESRIVPA